MSEVTVNRGIADHDMDPPVVAVQAEGGILCAGVLIAEDVVLTARHCTAVVAPHATCPAKGPQIESQLDPGALRVSLGDDAAIAPVAALGLALVVPATDVLCGADIALLLLDRPIKSVTPAVVQSVGVAKGQHVRSVGYGQAPGIRTLREHVPVVTVEPTEFRAAEATCIGAGGGPAFDEATGQVVGVLARFGPSCSGPDEFDVYARADVFYPLVDEALAQSMEAGQKLSHAHTTDPTDIGAACFQGSDCGAGVCVNDGSSQYCSRLCAETDKCPTDYQCASAPASSPVCLQSP